MQDWDDFPGGVSQSRLANYWDPDLGQAGGPYGSLSYPGLMERAQRPFGATGLGARWYAVSGNHEALRQGLAPGEHPAFNDAVATGCSKTFPSDAFGPTELGATTQASALERLASPEVLEQLRAGFAALPPDPARRMVGKRELRALHRTGDRDHGFGYTDRRELRASGGTAATTPSARAAACAWWAWTPPRRAGAHTATSTTPSTAGWHASWTGRRR